MSEQEREFKKGRDAAGDGEPDVEAHKKAGKDANLEAPDENEGSDDVEAHVKAHRG